MNGSPEAPAGSLGWPSEDLDRFIHRGVELAMACLFRGSAREYVNKFLLIPIRVGVSIV
jgi:hypothetical protein